MATALIAWMSELLVGAVEAASHSLGLTEVFVGVVVVAVGGAGIGYSYALGGAASVASIVGGRHCDEAARAFFAQYVSGMLPPPCR